MVLAESPARREVVQLFQRSFEQGRLGHAYLLSGESMSDIEAVARAVSQTVNCQSPNNTAPDGLPLDGCGHCVSCRKIAGDNHPDIQWLRPESKSRQIRIQQIVRRPESPARVLTDLINLPPTEGRFKVAVLVWAERMTVEAGNALLKSLEEPPQQTLFLLLTLAPDQVQETLVSRCLRLRATSGATNVVRDDEGLWVSEFARSAATAQQDVLARYRLIGSLADRWNSLKETVEEEQRERSPLSRHDEVPADLREQWEDELAAAVAGEIRHRREGYLRALQLWLRDVWMTCTGAENQAPTFPGLASESGIVAGRIASSDAMANLSLIEVALRRLDTNVQDLLTIEAALLRLKL